MSIDMTSIISDFNAVSADESLSKVIGLFKKNRELLVFGENEVFLGYLTQRYITRQSRLQSDTKVSSFIKKVPTVSKNTPLDKIARAILAAKVNSVPVEEEGRIIGIYRDIDIIRISGQVFKGKLVREIMSKDPITIKEDTTIARFIATSRTNNITRVPVVDSSNKLIGIVSPQDISDIIISELPRQTEGDRTGKQFDSLSLTIQNVMTTNVVTCRADDLVLEAVSKLYKTNHKALVVVDSKNHPIGILTTTDLLETISIPPKTEGYYIRVIGDVDEEDIETIVEMAIELVKKYAPMIGNSGQLFIHAKAVPKKKFRGFVLYQIRLRISTNKGKTYVARSEGYGVFSALAVSLDRLEREIISERELEIQHRQSGSDRYLIEELDEMLEES
ncbi:MAG: CBS domain-containing protein [Candidatus Heimdallarchaeaceae archaeon]